MVVVVVVEVATVVVVVNVELVAVGCPPGNEVVVGQGGAKA